MKLKRYYRHIYILGLTLIGYMGQLTAQEVQRYNATEANGYGVVYTLPKTMIEVTAIVEQEVYTPGELQPWGKRLIGISAEPSTQTSYRIKQMQIRPIGVADTTKQYLIAFDRKSVAPFVALAPGNIIYSINGQAMPSSQPEGIKPEAIPQPDRAYPALPREYAQATTMRQRATVAANYLNDLRERMTDIVMGQADNIPTDGEAMRLAFGRLQGEERRTLRLFVGDTLRSQALHRWVIDPSSIGAGMTFARFSTDWGIVDLDDLSGDALRITLEDKSVAPALSLEAQKRKDKLEGIGYNMPGKATAVVHHLGTPISQERISLTQLGTTEYLARRMLNIKEGATTAVYFDLTTGEIVRITNE